MSQRRKIKLKIGNDELSKVFWDSIGEYEKWLAYESIRIWIRLVKKIKIVKEEEQRKLFFNAVYINASLNWYWRYKFYAEIYSNAKDLNSKQQIIEELVTKQRDHCRLSYQTTAELNILKSLIKLEISEDKRGNKFKLQRVAEPRLKFIHIMAGIDKACEQLSDIDHKKVSASMKTNFIFMDDRLKDYVGETILNGRNGETIYNDWVNTRRKEWNTIKKYRIGSPDYPELGLRSYCDNELYAYILNELPDYLRMNYSNVFIDVTE